MKHFKILILFLAFLVSFSALAQEKKDFKPYFKLAEEALSLKESKYNKIWPGYNLNDFPIGLYNENEAYLINHSSPGDIFKKTGKKIYNYELFHSPQKPKNFFGNTSTEHNGYWTSIFMISNDMTDESFYNLLFHEVFHSFQRKNEIFKRRYGNVLLQPFFPVDDLEFYSLSFLEQKILKDAYLSDDQKLARKKIRQYFAISDKRNSMLDKKFIEFENNVQINEGIATYAGNKGLEIMGFYEKSKENLLYLINKKIDVPTGFRLRSYGTGRILAELLDKFYPDWKNNLQVDFVMSDVLKFKIKPKNIDLSDIYKEYKYDKIKEEFDELLRKQAIVREKQKNEILKPGYIVVKFPSRQFLDMSSTRFDPMNISLVDKQLLCHKSILTLAKKDRFNFKLSWYPILTEIAPTNLFKISKIFFFMPEDAEITINNNSVEKIPSSLDIKELIIKSKSINMTVKNVFVKKTDSFYILEIK